MFSSHCGLCVLTAQDCLHTLPYTSNVGPSNTTQDIPFSYTFKRKAITESAARRRIAKTTTDSPIIALYCSWNWTAKRGASATYRANTAPKTFFREYYYTAAISDRNRAVADLPANYTTTAMPAQCNSAQCAST